MKYFVSFKDNNTVDSSWSREDETNHPSYIPKDKIYEVSEEFYKKNTLLVLEDGVVKYDAAKLAKKQVRDQKKSAKDNALAKFKAMKNSDIDTYGLPELRKTVKSLLDIIADRDELSDEPL
jgi:hypothetical protein